VDEEIQVDEAELERFAGSSEEEEGDDDDAAFDQDEDENDGEDEDEDETVPMKQQHEDRDDDSSDDGGEKAKSILEEEPQDDEYALAVGDDEQDSSSDEDEQGGEVEARKASMGMSNAMSRILGISSNRNDSNKPIVLSKTVTPLQKQAAKEKEELKQAQEKRRLNKERKELVALHMPLSVATTANRLSVGADIARELDQEKTHRRVATRGVVALFNAIAQHQQKNNTDASPSNKNDKNKNDTINKHDFLEQIKSKAVTTAAKQGATESLPKTVVTTNKQEPQQSPSKWNALQDDFLLNPKKNWDQDDDDDDDSLEENEKPANNKKGRGNDRNSRDSKRARVRT